MSIPRDQNLVICPKKKRREETETWSFVQKKGQNLAITEYTHKCFRIKLEHSHNKRMSIRVAKVNQGGCQGMIHRVQTWEPPLPWTSLHPDRQSTQPRNPVEGQFGAEVLLSHLQAFCQINIGPSAVDAPSQIPNQSQHP